MTTITTRFDPQVHGFQFRNSFPGGAVVAELARQDRLSELTGLKVPRAVRDLTDLASGESFWGNFGLCGGMSATSLERFKQGRQISAERTVPGRDTDLFRELVRRQADSLQGRKVLERCFVWQLLPDRAPVWMFWTHGVAKETIEEQWPRLQSALRAGNPTLIVLLRGRGVTNPDVNHQVVAVGVDVEDDGSAAAVHIYDPNHPRRRPSFPLDLRNHTVGPRQSTGEVVRGFFL